MYAGRLGNLLWRQRAFLITVVLAAFVASYAWDGWGATTYVASAEVLVAAKIPAGSQSGQYDVEFSRASTTDFLVDDLTRIVQGNAFANLVAENYVASTGKQVSPAALAQGLSATRTHRGLHVILRWPDRAQADELIGYIATTLSTAAADFYPALPEVADLSIIDLAGAGRPGLLANALDIILKVAVAAVAALAIGVWWDIARARLYAEDVEELLDLRVLAKIE